MRELLARLALIRRTPVNFGLTFFLQKEYDLGKSASCRGPQPPLMMISYSALRRILCTAALGAAVGLIAASADAATATAVASSRSLGMDAFSGTLANGTHVTNYVTTSDGAPGVSHFLDRYGNLYFNQELRPIAGQNGVYQADYVTYDDFGNPIDFGGFTVNLPITDSDANGVPDFEQKSKPGNFSFSGTAISDVYHTVGTVTGTSQRNANSTSATYSVTSSIPGSSATFYSGKFYLLNASGSISYFRTPTNSGTFSLVETFQSGFSRTLTGSTPFTVISADQVSFPQFTVASSDGYAYTVKPFTLARRGTQYGGAITLVDGDPLTTWTDYASWVLEITDLNDANLNGIPDFSDVITGPLTGHPLNISTRLKVLTGDNVSIAGFIVTGTGPKKVLVRGIGPSLAAANISDFLADPTLELHSGSAIIATNNDWKDTQQAEIEATTIPPTKDREAAIVMTLNPGAYTAILAGKNGSSGVGLIEIYDLDQSAQSKLANISTRGFVNLGENVMIGGFIIGGLNGGSGKMVVRAIGPSLTALGVAGALQDPSLEIYDSNGTTVTNNNNWRDSQASEITATGLAPSDERESAVVITLPSGAYTTVVRGVNNMVGVGLVEAYNVP